VNAYSGGEEDKTRLRFDVYKLEYEKCADRYENIYKGIWQNFSYMAALSAGIASFGEKTLGPWLWFAALAPLVFWYFATYLPMDSYARQARSRAGKIENVLNELFLGFESTDSSKSDQRIQHYHEFGETDPRFHFLGKTRFKRKSAREVSLICVAAPLVLDKCGDCSLVSV